MQPTEGGRSEKDKLSKTHRYQQIWNYCYVLIYFFTRNECKSYLARTRCEIVVNKRVFKSQCHSY